MTRKRTLDNLKIKNAAAWQVSQVSRDERFALFEGERDPALRQAIDAGDAVVAPAPPS